MMDVKDFAKMGEVQATDSDNGLLVHIDNGADVLAVCHLDWVLHQAPIIIDNYIHCGQLDDRLGAWVILHYLPTLTNTKYDILLCDLEEVGKSTAKHFKTTKKYNWMFEFDRMGKDVVMYQYGNDKMKEMLKGYGFENHSRGSFTDIAALESLGCRGFNIGVGYHGQHTERCYANLDDTISNVDKFVKMLDEQAKTHLPFVKEEFKHIGYNREHNNVKYKNDYWDFTKDEYDDDYYYGKNSKHNKNSVAMETAEFICNSCYWEIDLKTGYEYCPYCGEELFNDPDDDTQIGP